MLNMSYHLQNLRQVNDFVAIAAELKTNNYN